MNFLKLNWNIILTIGKRGLKSYFNNPTGYLFITLFIFLSAAAAFWQERFFAENLANLNQLNMVFPLLLLFFIPALTMNVWSEEKRQGTDELLLTLPASDLEIVLGKYLSVLGIYTASVLLSFSHVFVLYWLGSPDLGLMISNYIGFWLLGSALLAVGMLASLLSSNGTISFILGGLFCSIVIFVGSMDWLIGVSFKGALESLSIFPYFGDFSRGMISLSGLLYFALLGGAMLYLNIVIIGRRHWPVASGGLKMWTHHAIRAGALFVAIGSLVFIFLQLPLRIDATAENLHSLSDETRHLIKTMPENRPVLIQAFISPEVPRNLVETRTNIISKLREIAAIGGDHVQVLLHDTEPYSETARDAREKFGIVPREMMVSSSARTASASVFMGIAFTSGAEEEVIRFFEPGFPVEYELMRTIRVVTHTERKRIGIISSAIKLFGDLNYQTGSRVPPWRIVAELEKQYDVVMVNPADEIASDIDALLVTLPSSLPQDQMDWLEAYLKSGRPALLLVDPMPLFEISLSPVIPAGTQTNPFMQNQGQQPPPKGDIGRFMANIGVGWDPTTVIWDAYNPHPNLASLQQEIIFVGPGNQNREAFNNSNSASSGLQEAVMLYPGSLGPTGISTIMYEPLIQTGTVAGAHQWFNLVQRGFFGMQLKSRLKRVPTGASYTLAARYKGLIDNAGQSTAGTIDLIVIADIDFISEQFFQIRDRGIASYNFDNITFFLNCIDILAGDESFVDLRKKRIHHRTLTSVEARTEEYIQRRLRQETDAETQAQQALSEAQARLDENVATIRSRTDLDEQTKQIMTKNLQEVETRRFEGIKKGIESRKEATMADGREEMEMAIKAIQSGIKTLAVLLPPVPVFIMGVVIFIRRRRRENVTAQASRLVRK